MLTEEELKAADEELQRVQEAVKKMMKDKRLTVIPNPCPVETDDMSIFGLDMENTKGTYILKEDGEVLQVTTGYEPEEE